MNDPASEPRIRIPAAPGWLALAAGTLVCTGLARYSGDSVAWASQLYYLLGIPLLCVAVALISYRYPRHAGRWTAWMALGQCLSALFTGAGFAGVLQGILFMMVLSLPQFITAIWLSRFGLRARGRVSSSDDNRS